MRAARSFSCLILCLSLAAAVLAAEPPRLVVDQADGLNLLWVEVADAGGELQRFLLRETSATLTPGDTGWGPQGRAAFARWTEAGSSWAAYGRDHGRSWSEARPLNGELRLRAGRVAEGGSMPSPAPGLSLPAGASLFIVQFKTQSLPEWRATLDEAGAEVFNFMPRNAHLVRIGAERVAQLRGLDIVERVEPYHPSYRLEPELLTWLAAPASEAEELRLRVWALEWGPEGKTRILEHAERLGARAAEFWPSGHVLELWATREQLKRIAAHDDVLWVDRWTAPETDMDLVREDSGANWLESNFGSCGQGVRGEVMDSGVESTHQDFDGILLHTAFNVASHGTSTYGIVFGNGARDGDGNAQATGHLPCAEQGIFADYGSVSDRFAHTQELKDAPYFASFQTNSWGNARTTQYNSVSAEMDDIIFRLDIAILQSQSNAGNQQSRPQAWAKNIISVGGIRHYNTLSTADDAWNSGASIGPAADGRIKPDVNYWYDSIFTTTTNNSYTSGFGGTSAATPEAAGVLGLMVQLWSDNVWGTDPVGGTVFERQPHTSTMKALLINNANQYTFTGSNSDLTRTHQGWGRPSAQLARERASESFIVDQEQALQLGQSASYDVTVTAGQPELKVTMIYPDPAGTTSSTLHRINDVDLEVVSPGGTVYHGNVGLDAGNYSTPGGSPNGIDTVENVFVQNPTAGTWNVNVHAVEVNQDGNLGTVGDDVVFALVVTGGSAFQECGNGVQEGTEQCDGLDLGGATCADAGCTGGGTLRCAGDCTFDLTDCLGCPGCDENGTCGPNENCFSCPSDCRSGTELQCGNGVCETRDGENCLSCPQDCNGKQSGKPATRYCCGDGGGANPVSCTDARCNSSGNTCSTVPAGASCCGDGVCEGDEDATNCDTDCGGCSATETSCTGGVDEDCDTLVDCADPDCATDPACCTLAQLGESCTIDGDCCSNKCKGPSGGKTCK